VPVRPPARPEPRPGRRADSRAAPVAPPPIPVPTFTMPPFVDAGVRSDPPRASVQVQELSPGVIADLGRAIPTPGSEAGAAPGLARIPAPQALPTGKGESFRPGLDQVAELVNGASSACPELRRPAGWAGREVAVAVAFVVDTNGRVDPHTLRVIESPNRPRTEHRAHSHIYIIGATMRDDPDRLDRTAYDSLARHDVASHVAGLLFRPALMEGRATRSTVMVSCQTS